jgi:PAS domain S-box-containing protein
MLQKRGTARLEGRQPPNQYEFKVIRKDGAVRWVLTSAGRIVFDGQNAVIATLLDITDLKNAEEALQTSDERFRQVSETAQEWIWEVDLNGMYTYTSPVVEDILGYRPDEVVGKKCFYDFYDPADREQLKREMLGIFARKQRFKDFPTRNRHKDGREVMLSASGRPILDGQGTLFGYRGLDVDITGRIRAEQEKARLYEESVDHYQALLDEQQRHQAEKENILKDLHDGIGGLTTNINLLAELARTTDDLAAIKRSLATIAELSRESLSEIRGFIQSLDTKELSWQAIAAEFRYLGSTMIEPHGVRFSITTEVPENGGMPSSAMTMNLFRIYKESLSNIVKHARATEVSVSFTVGGNKLILDVRDNGVGFREKRGKGRGLLNMKTRAAKVGGKLTVTSGKGTHIVAEIPLP